MSNLSDLLPAGAGAKSASFTASGTLSSGQTVALKSDGTVEGIAVSVSDPVIGTTADYTTSPYSFVSYDTTNDVFVFCYKDFNNNEYLTVQAATLEADGTLTMGTAVVYSTAVNYVSGVVHDGVIFGLCHRASDGTGIAYTAAISSGTSIGSISVDFSFSYSMNGDTFVAHDPDEDCFVSLFNSTQNGDMYGKCFTSNGSSISYGSDTRLTNSGGQYPSNKKCVYDTTNDTWLAIYRGTSSGNYIGASTFTVSGTSITSIDEQNLSSNLANDRADVVYDANLDKFIAVFMGPSPNRYFVGVTITHSSGTMSIGSVTTLKSSQPNDNNMMIAYDPAAQKCFTAIKVDGQSNYTFYLVNVSGTTPSLGTEVTWTTSVNRYLRYYNFAYNPDTEKTYAFPYRSSTQVTLVPITLVSKNFTNFVGITDEAIANAATGSVVVEGGVTEKVSGLTTGSTYYVQSDGTLSTTSSSVTAGKALSATKLLLKG